VLDPGIVPAEHRAAGGLSVAQLKSMFEMLAQCEVIGLEIAEFQSSIDD